MSNREILLTYANNKIKIAALEAENEMLKSQCLSEVQTLRGDTDSPVQLTELPGYSFGILHRKTWTYTDFVKDSEKALKERKKEEEKTGDATFVETEHLLFTSPKND